jgi:uncharacterized protein
VLRKLCALVIVLTLAAPAAPAQTIALAQPLSADVDNSALMPQLAAQLLGSYRDSDRERYLDNLFRLQLVAGHEGQALQTLRTPRDLSDLGGLGDTAFVNLRWEIYARARLAEAARARTFDDGFREIARGTLQQLDDKSAYALLYSLGTPLSYLESTFQEALRKEAGKSSLPVPDALDLVRKYLNVVADRRMQPLYAAVSAEDDERRYIVQKDIGVKTPDGATVCVLIVRPRNARRLPALLSFTIYYDPVVKLDDARRTAANGYAGVVGFTRGKACSPDSPIPIEHDGADAATVIDWISRQPWNDGRVGMYGGSYEGFTQWAAAKHMPRALRGMMPAVTFAPGIDFPMEGNIFLSQAYSWPRYTTDNKSLDNETYYDQPHWDRLHRDWYVSGRAYRELDKVDGRPNPFFDRWLDHPSYDTYWQAAIPFREEFAHIDIPVLTTTGYYDSGQIGALYYFMQRAHYQPGAENYLVIGPYDHRRGQLGTISPLGTSTTEVLRGYALDPVAQLDIIALRYQWFDYLFKRGPKPAILKNRVNYQVMGANIWKHAPSIAAMAAHRRRYYLTDAKANGGFRLDTTNAAPDAFVTQEVDLADRSDVERMLSRGPLIDQTDDTWSIVDQSTNLGNSIAFVSEPFTTAPEVSGLFSGQLDFITNKKDFDFSVTLFELTGKGQYFQLSYCWHRASFTADRSRRQLLTPGQRTQLSFEAGRLTSRQFAPGSRLVVVVGIIKQPGEEINYGTDGNVSEESIADGKVPLRINWYGHSFVEIPLSP